MEQLSRPTPGTPPPTAAERFEAVWRRLGAAADFPGLAATITQVLRLAQSDSESLHSLADEVLKDVALTQKLLRLVNSAGFHHAGGGGITTVSRAAALVGFGGVRNLALSLALLERLHGSAHARWLKGELLRNLLAGAVARELAQHAGEGEELFLGAMLQGLGRLLVEFHLPADAAAIRHELAAVTDGRSAAEASAARRVLGLSYAELGMGVAQRWGLPSALTQLMQRPAGDAPTRPVEPAAERQRWTAAAANDVADAVLVTDPAHLPLRLRALGQQFGRALRCGTAGLEEATQRARSRLADMADAMDLRLPPGDGARRLLPLGVPAAAAPGAQGGTPRSAHAAGGEVAERLAAGIEHITEAMLDTDGPSRVPGLLLDTLQQALGLHRVLLAVRNPERTALVGRFGLGPRIDEVLPRFCVPLQHPAGAGVDVFSTLCQRGADSLITDATQPSLAQGLPAWWRRDFAAGSFAALPLMAKGEPVGLIYGDCQAPGGLNLDGHELAMLRTLRSQALMALRQLPFE